MNKHALVIFLFLVVSVIAGVLLWSFGVFDEPKDHWYRDLRREHWIWWGAEAKALDETLQKIAQAPGDRKDHRHDTIIQYGPGHWTYEFAALGAARLEQARNAVDAEDARRLYHQASVYYGLAKYPGYGVDKNEIEAHRAQLLAYEASLQLHPALNFSVLEIPVRNGVIRGYLHAPIDRSEKVPLVIGTNGIDVFKAEFGPIVDALAERGIAFFAFDMPSTGEAAAYPLKPDNDGIYIEVMQTLQRRPDIDENRVALWGVSFGGNPVARVAQKAPGGLRAVVNWCGPIHEVFRISEFQLSLVADMYLDALRYRTHMPEADGMCVLVSRLRAHSAWRGDDPSTNTQR